MGEFIKETLLMFTGYNMYVTGHNRAEAYSDIHYHNRKCFEVKQKVV